MGGSAEKLNAASTSPRRRPRKCVGCGCEQPKGELLRIVRSPEGRVSINLAGKAAGRGAYICANPDCIEAARKRNALARSLKHPVDSDIYRELKEYVSQQGGGDAEPAD